MLKMLRYLSLLLILIQLSCLKAGRKSVSPASNIGHTTDSTADFHQWFTQMCDSLSQRQHDTICILASPLSKAQPESGMTNWLANAVWKGTQKECRPDICILGYDLISTPYFPPGPLLRSDLYRMIEQDDALGIIELDGRQIRTLCDSIAAQGGIPVAGLRMIIRDKSAESISIKQKAVHPDLVYRVLANQRLLQSSKMPTFMYHSRHWRECQPSVRYVLFRTTEGFQDSVLHVSTDQRIYYAE